MSRDADSLEALLEEPEESGSGVNLEAFNVVALIDELNKALNESSFYSKSRITSRNLRGILRSMAFQEYLFKRYGFRIESLDTLIEEKLKNVLSIDGRGRKEIMEMVSKGTLKVEARSSSADIADKLFGNPPR